MISRFPIEKRRWRQASLLLTTTFYFVLALNTNVKSQSVIPFPTPKPIYTGSITSQAGSLETHTTQQPSRTSATALKRFFSAFHKKQTTTALEIKEGLRHSLDRKIASWMIATSSTRGFSYQTLLTNAAEVKAWPGQGAMALAREKTLVKAGNINLSVARALPARPVTDDGKLLQLMSYAAAGHKMKTVTLLNDYWVNENFTAALENQILRRFGTLLNSTHHKARADRLLYDDRANGALRLFPYLSKSDQALVHARVSVIRRNKSAKSRLDALPQSAKRDPGYFFSRVQNLRRADKWLEAGKVIVKAPKDYSLLVDPKQWWIERRLVSRKVLEAGYPKLAYQIASGHTAKRTVTKVDAEFHSGWYALRFLNNPKAAFAHFQTIADISTKPLSKSRAYYWMARAKQAEGDKQQAGQYYHDAARFPQTYYGQLALRSLGKNSVALPRLPNTASSRNSFERNLFVQIIKRLNIVGQKGRTGIFYRHLGQTMTDPGELTQLASLSDRNGLHPISLQIGKLAVSRGVDVPRLAFPLGAIPGKAGITNTNKAVAYAIARQESAFNIGATSSAGALGLMQLLPETAKRTARSIAIPYKRGALTTDGAYNARLGVAFFNQMMKRFGGSYILAFAAYNAGPGRSDQWIKRFGDPRLNTIDAVDWVEAIPFSETRNYVQRVMENFQVYRHRLENAPLTIVKDLNRGHPS